MPYGEFGRQDEAAEPEDIQQLHAILDHGDSDRIAETVRLAELKTSAEIVVRISATLDDGDLDAIVERHFTETGLASLEQQNGVLIYVSLHRRKVRVLVGPAADRQIAQETWKQAADRISAGFRDNRAADGIVDALESMIGPALAEQFPCDGSDTIDLPNIVRD